MGGDNLTIPLFFVGTAFTFGIGAVTLVERRRQIIMGILFAGAFVCAILGVFWTEIGPRIPLLSRIASDIASNSVAWFVLIMVILVVTLISIRERQFRIPSRIDLGVIGDHPSTGREVAPGTPHYWIIAIGAVIVIGAAVVLNYRQSGAVLRGGDRYLVSEQKQRFISLATFATRNFLPGEHVTFSIEMESGCLDCPPYAKQIAEMINSIPGWSVPVSGIIFGPGFKSNGLTLILYDTTPSAISEAVTLSFRASGLQFNIVNRPKNSSPEAPSLLSIAVLTPRS